MFKLKRLIPAAAGLLAAVSFSVSASVFVPFTVNETAVPGANVLGAANPSLVADKLNGAYQEILTITGANTFASTAVADFTGYYTNNGTTGVPSLLSSLEVFGGYKIYALFSSVGTFSGTAFTSTNNTFSLFVDTGSNTTFTAPALALLPYTRTNSADDLLLATANISLGTGDTVGPPGAFNLDFENLTLTPFGSTYFVSPNPFHMYVRVNGDIDGFTPTVGTSAQITGDVSAGFLVPEPGSLALAGLGLLGLALTRRRQAK